MRYKTEEMTKEVEKNQNLNDGSFFFILYYEPRMCVCVRECMQWARHSGYAAHALCVPIG